MKCLDCGKSLVPTVCEKMEVHNEGPVEEDVARDGLHIVIELECMACASVHKCEINGLNSAITLSCTKKTDITQLSTWPNRRKNP